MTVLNENNKISYFGDGSTTEFQFTGSSGFNCFDETDLVVEVEDDATGNMTALAITTQYIVTGAGTSNGYITLLDPESDLPTGTTLHITRNVPATQEADFTYGDDMNEAVLNNALDKLTMLIIQLTKRVEDIETLLAG